MTLLIAGLLLFLGVHSVRIVADDWRSAQLARIGEKAWKGLYTLASLAGLALIIWGYGQARQQPVLLWPAPAGGLRQAAGLLNLLAFVLIAAAQVPGNAIKARLGHPMLLGVKVWALAHLITNNSLADLLLFAAFLAWAVLCFRAARARDRAASAPRPASSPLRTLLAVGAGVAGWAVFAFWAHTALIGVNPLS